MSVWALVPLKALARSKRRLAPLLGEEGCRRLVRLMFEDVAATLGSVPGLSGVAVVTPERTLVPTELEAIADPGGGLNAALAHGARVLAARGVRSVLVVPADVPLARADEIEAILEAGQAAPVVIAPDRAGLGTNGLYQSLESPIPFRFGEGSAARHADEARARGLSPSVLALPWLGADVDHPADLTLLAAESPGRYASFLRTYEIAS